MNQEFLDNQTLFAEEEPQHTGRTRKKESVVNFSAEKPKPIKFIVIGGLVIVTVIILGIFMLQRGEPPQNIVEATPTPTKSIQSPSQIEQLLTELEAAANNADPTETALPFPPVAEQIRISQ